MDPLQSLLFFATAAAGGAINAVAGGGSFLLFPVLMLGGLPPVAANIMCTIALWPGSVASSIAYWREVRTPIATLKILLIFCLVGSAIGAWLLLTLPEVTFERAVPWLMLAATLVFAFGRRVLSLLRKEHSAAPPFIVYSGMFIISIYGGYFGAGIGILMLALLQLIGHTHMHEMNALKTVLGSAINAVALIIFVAGGEVVWSQAPVLIVGGMAGGYVGTILALKIEPEKVRALVILIAFAMTTYFFIRAA